MDFMRFEQYAEASDRSQSVTSPPGWKITQPSQPSSCDTVGASTTNRNTPLTMAAIARSLPAWGPSRISSYRTPPGVGSLAKASTHERRTGTAISPPPRPGW